MSTSFTAGSWPPPMRAGHGQALVAAFFAGLPALQRRRGRAQQHLGAFQLAAVHRQVARGVARAFLLLVAGVVFLVHHDQAQPGRTANTAMRVPSTMRACPGVRGQPGLQALRVRHAAVQRDHLRGAKAGAPLEALLPAGA
jgi:hypothetical protein